jgi:hypothetical protein
MPNPSIETTQVQKSEPLTAQLNAAAIAALYMARAYYSYGEIPCAPGAQDVVNGGTEFGNQKYLVGRPDEHSVSLQVLTNPYGLDQDRRTDVYVFLMTDIDSISVSTPIQI